jgi:hypothetical protein
MRKGSRFASLWPPGTFGKWFLAVLLAPVLAGAAASPPVSVSADRWLSPEAILRVTGVEEGQVYFSPVTPLIEARPGYSVTALLNGQPYQGGPISFEEGPLHELVVMAEGPHDVRSELVMAFAVAAAEGRAPHHTIDLELLQIRKARKSPHVRPTASADENFVLGQSMGWPADPEIPPHDLHGYQITDASVADASKLRVVLVGGNHPREQTGSWALRGLIDFLISDQPEAEVLRRMAVFYVYPMVNPDGRFLAENRNNPELAAARQSDHNRVWNTSGRFSTIDVVAPAMRADTGGTADFLLDFHSASSTFFYTLPEMADVPLARAITRRDPEMMPRTSLGHPGMVRVWALTKEGLSARVAFTPEIAGGETAPRSMEIGRNHGLAFYDLFTGNSVVAEVRESLAAAPEGGFGEVYRSRLRAALDRFEEIANAGQPRAVADEADPVFSTLRDFESARSLGQRASAVTASSAVLTEEQEEGFARLFQAPVRQRIKAVNESLRDEEAGRAVVEETLGELLQSLEAYWQVQEVVWPPLRPVVVPGTSVTYTVGNRADWEDALLVNVMAEEEGLVLAKTPVLEFGGEDQYVVTEFRPGEALLGDAFTWEFWKYHRSFARNSGSSGSDGNTPRFYTQIMSPTGVLRAAIGDTYWDVATLPAPEQWYHIAFVYDRGTVRTFVDGGLVDTRRGVSFSGENEHPFSIGRGYEQARWLDGYTREHRIWKTARTETELLLHRHRRLSGSEAGLVANWRLDEGAGEKVTDYAGGQYGGESRGLNWRPFSQPGYRLSQPLSFPGIERVNTSHIAWETEWDSGEANDLAAVFIGITESETVLPQEWRQATNGGPVPFLGEGMELAGKYLWIKQCLEPPASGVPPRMQRLTLAIE